MNTWLFIVTCVSVAATTAMGVHLWRVRTLDRERSQARIEALSDAMEGATSSFRRSPGIAVGSLFNPAGARLDTLTAVRVAAGAIMALGMVATLVVTANRATAPDRGDVPPLELLSMRHELNGSTLRIVGLVRNPVSAETIRPATAVVTAFDSSGVSVAIRTATLGEKAIEPGAESTFVVDIPTAGNVVRYRVGFRGGALPIRHVDRRTVVASRDGM